MKQSHFQKDNRVNYEEVEPGTFLPLNGPEEGLLHHYFTEDELIKIFERDFEILSIRYDRLNHLCLIGRKKGE